MHGRADESRQSWAGSETAARRTNMSTSASASSGALVSRWAASMAEATDALSYSVAGQRCRVCSSACPNQQQGPNSTDLGIRTDEATQDHLVDEMVELGLTGRHQRCDGLLASAHSIGARTSMRPSSANLKT